MSIVYGSHGQILEKTVESGPLSSVKSVYFTIPWSNASIVRDITLMSGQSVGTGISIYIPLNNSHIHAGKSGIVGVGYTNNYHFAYEGLVSAVGGNFVSVANLAGRGEIGAYTEDVYNRNYLHVAVHLESTISTPLRLNVSGQKTYQTSYTKTDNNGLRYLQDYSVVVGRNQSGGAGGTMYDMTSYAKMNGSNNYSNQLYIDNANDYIYVGSTNRITMWDFKVGLASTTIGVLQGQLWSGSSWIPFRVLDNTASVMGVNTLRYSGLVEGLGIGTSTEWVQTKLDSTLSANLTDDPATILERAIVAGTTKAITMFTNPSRYWVRFKVQSITGKVDLAGVLPVL